MASGTAAPAREPGLRSSDAFANALGPLCSARRPRGAEQSARVEPPPTAPAHDTPHTTYPLYAQQPAPAELVKQPTRPQASPGGALEYSVDFGAVCDAPAFLRTLCMHPGSHLRAPTVHPGKLTARKALGSFSSAPTSASGRAQHGSRSGALEHLRSCVDDAAARGTRAAREATRAASGLQLHPKASRQRV